MKAPRALKATGLVLGALVLGLMTVQGTYALWNAVTAVSPGTVQAADFNVDIRLNEQNMAQTQQTVLEPVGLYRGTATYTALRVTNNVNVTQNSPLVLQPTVAAPVPRNNLNGNLTVTTAVVQGSGACTAGLPYKAGAPVLPVLAKGATQTVCVKVALSSSTPANQLGQPVEIPVNLSVAQLAPAA